MLDFIFFHEKPYNLFIEKLNQRKIDYKIKPDPDQSEFSILLHEDMSEETLLIIEEDYETLMDLNQQLIEAEEGDHSDNYHLSSIAIHLADGTISHAQVDPQLIRKIFQVISPEEFSNLVSNVVDAVEKTESRNLCQQVRDDDIKF